MSPTDYYASQSDITDPHSYSGLFDDLPASVAALCSVVQGLIIHPYLGHLYGVRVPRKRLVELDIRLVSRMLARIYELDSRPLTVKRLPDKRLAGNCRDFATMLCAMLRWQGTPARVRYGFAAYFEPDFYTDHVVCEYWNEGEQRRVVVDAQVDDVQCKVYQIAVDTRDVPGDSFVFASKAWQMYRAGEANPARFGLFPGGPGGELFIRSGLVRDLAAINKQELLCQDVWGLGDVEDDLTEDDLALLDRVALHSSLGNVMSLQRLYQGDSRLRVPPVIKCYAQNGVKMVDLATGEYVEDVRPL